MTRAGETRSVGAAEDETMPSLLLDVAARPEEVSSARHAIADHLARKGVASLIVDDMELVTSELVTNAIIHPHPPDGCVNLVRVEVFVSEQIVIAVSNVGSAAAIPPVDEWRPAPPTAVAGRGLGIVRRLCDEVVVEQRGDRAIVRCRRRLPDGGAAP